MFICHKHSLRLLLRWHRSGGRSVFLIMFCMCSKYTRMCFPEESILKSENTGPESGATRSFLSKNKNIYIIRVVEENVLAHKNIFHHRQPTEREKTEVFLSLAFYRSTSGSSGIPFLLILLMRTVRAGSQPINRTNIWLWLILAETMPRFCSEWKFLQAWHWHKNMFSWCRRR